MACRGLQGGVQADRCFCPAQNHFPNFLHTRQGPCHICVEEAPPGALMGNERAAWLPVGVPPVSGAQEDDSWEGPEVPHTLIKPL